MIKYENLFGLEIGIEFPTTFHNRRVGFAMKNSRQHHHGVYESWDLETAKQIAAELDEAIREIDDVGE